MAKSSTSASQGRPKTPAIPHPSASVILISPTNQVLLLHRVKTSSSFASAHVFPGGNLDPFHDGPIPDVTSPNRHIDGESYRLGAIRETFEESGLLLAHGTSGNLLQLPSETIVSAREEIHSNKTPFVEWLSKRNGQADVNGLIPFTRWITPMPQPKRFTTQMYIYFLPLSSPSSSNFTLPAPTHDGGKEHTAAEFAHASEWLARYSRGGIIFFPPQFVLLSLISEYLKPASSNEELERQRVELRQFVDKGRWGEKCIHVRPLKSIKDSDRVVMDMSWPGKEVEGQDRFGETELVFTSSWGKQGPRELKMGRRSDFENKEKPRM